MAMKIIGRPCRNEMKSNLSTTLRHKHLKIGTSRYHPWSESIIRNMFLIYCALALLLIGNTWIGRSEGFGDQGIFLPLSLETKKNAQKIYEIG